MRLGYHTITWRGVTGDAVGVASLKDLLYRMPGSMDRA
jgi:inosose dehydratase